MASHGGYSWRGNGVVSYYAVETRRSVITFAGVRVWALAATLSLNAFPAYALASDICRLFRSDQGGTI